MALRKKIKTPTGAVASYWNINYVEILGDVLTIRVNGYTNKVDREENRLPLFTSEYKTNYAEQRYYFIYKDKNYEFTLKNIHRFDSETHFKNIMKSAYQFLKQQPEFLNAIDEE